MATKLTLSQACEGMIQYKVATGKSKYTIADYRSSFKKLFLFFPEDMSFGDISRKKLIAFFSWLQDGYKTEPDGVAPRGQFKLSPKSILNIHINISSLWTWAVDEGFVDENIVRKISPPPVEAPVIETFTKDDIALLLKSCERSRTWKNKSSISNSRPTADRDRAIVALLLDTGIRASELCNICFGDINIKTKRIHIFGKGGGHDKKERFVYFGRRTSQLIWKYLLPRMDEIQEDDPVFVVGSLDYWKPMNRSVLWKQLRRLGEKAGVSKTYPHRFRHTFAINFLRNGGDIFTLQAMLGHSDLAMVQRYARIANMDVEKAHRKASPVDNWRL